MSGGFDSSFDGSFEGSSELPPLDLVEHAVSRLPHMYRSGDPARPTNTEKSLRARLGPANALAQAMRDVLTKRNIDTAIGAQLDVIGAIVGRKRNGADDETYRAFCRAQILTNKSDGTRRNLLAVARAVVPGASRIVAADRIWNAAAIYDVQGVTVEAWRADVLAELLGQATSAGVRTIIVYTTGPITNQARWGTGTWGNKGNASRARDTDQ